MTNQIFTCSEILDTRRRFIVTLHSFSITKDIRSYDQSSISSILGSEWDIIYIYKYFSSSKNEIYIFWREASSESHLKKVNGRERYLSQNDKDQNKKWKKSRIIIVILTFCKLYIYRDRRRVLILWHTIVTINWKWFLIFYFRIFSYA